MELRGFVDDNSTLWGTVIDGYEIHGGIDWLASQGNLWCVCAIGVSKVRKKVIEKARQYQNIQFATLIDPSVQMSERIEIGEGSIICARSLLTVDIRIGEHVIINLACTVGHDACLANYVTLYPSVNISGFANIGECAELGTGMQIIQGKNIGANSIIGAGAVVIKDIPNNCVAVGSPAKVIEHFD